jgi:adenine phosphoribosyltransferase
MRLVSLLARDRVAQEVFLQPTRRGNNRRPTQRDAIKAAAALLRHGRGANVAEANALRAALKPLSRREIRLIARQLAAQTIEKAQLRNPGLFFSGDRSIKIEDVEDAFVSLDDHSRYDATVMPLDLKAYVRNVPDFPRAGVMFRDITPLVQDPAAYRYAVDALIEGIEPLRPDAIVAIESRGFLFGAPIALRLGLPFVPVRKPGHLPAEHMSVEYALEYGESQLDIHVDALERGQRAVIVDDLLATGGTAAATAQLVERLGASVAGFAFVIELTFLRGRALLTSENVIALVSYEDES